MQDKAPEDYVTAYTDGDGAKHIAPYSLVMKGNAKKILMKRNTVLSNFDVMPLDAAAVSGLQYQGTENLENVNKELAKTPSTERKGVYHNG